MKWSKIIPTEPGVYWWQEDAKSKAYVIELSRRSMAKMLSVRVFGSERVTELLPVFVGSRPMAWTDSTGGKVKIATCYSR